MQRVDGIQPGNVPSVDPIPKHPIGVAVFAARRADIKGGNKHDYRDNRSLNTHAREEKLWTGPKMILWIKYDGFPLQLVLRRDENENWEASNVFHAVDVLICPFCNEQEEKSCEKAADYMDQLAEDALNHPSFRLIALFEM